MPDGVFPSDAAKVGSCELAIPKIGEVHPRLSEIGTTQIGTVKRALHQIGLDHGRPTKVAIGEIGFRQIRAVKDGATEGGAAVSAAPQQRVGLVLKGPIQDLCVLAWSVPGVVPGRGHDHG